MVLNAKNILSNIQIYKIYWIAIFVYVLPFISLGVFIIDQMTLQKTEMIFWLIFLLGMLPCGLAGMLLSYVGLRLSNKNKNKLNKSIGIIGVIGGTVILGGGLLGLMLIYIVVGG
ncbi:MAG: hypothetical protein ACEQSR_11980 [Candidatus Methylacidiphilales bacterium]